MFPANRVSPSSISRWEREVRAISPATHAITLMMLGFVTAGALLAVPNVGIAGQGSEATVTIDNFTFVPPALKISRGTRVIWINRDDIPHTIVSSSGPQAFRSPPLDTDEKFSMQFDQRGEYRYFCSIHPMMTATIVVQ
jgi:plastocyanin